MSPDEARERYLLVEQVRRGAHGDGTGCHVDLGHVAPPTGTAEVEPATLSNRDQLHRVDLAERDTRVIDHRATMQGDALAEEGGATAPRRQDETDILALGLRGGPQSACSGHVANLPFGHLPDGELDVGEHISGDGVQHVALVLRRVDPPRESPTSAMTHPTGVMAGRNRVEAQRARPIDQPVELDRTIALDARVGCAAFGVRRDVGVDHVAAERIGEVEHVVLDPELVRDLAGIVHVGHRAAARVRLATPQPHRHPHDVAAGLDQQRRGDRTVDTTRHRDHHAVAASTRPPDAHDTIRCRRARWERSAVTASRIASAA
ncbi:MAG: hypothetical protein R2698_14345 [Microthrixaceae bacterium]